MICTQAELTAYAAEAKCQAEKEFRGLYAKRKVSLACEAMRHALSWMHNLPTGWTVKQNRRMLSEMCHNHLKRNFKPEAKGFLPGLLLGWIISGVISWVVKYVLDLMLRREGG